MNLFEALRSGKIPFALEEQEPAKPVEHSPIGVNLNTYVLAPRDYKAIQFQGSKASTMRIIDHLVENELPFGHCPKGHLHIAVDGELVQLEDGDWVVTTFYPETGEHAVTVYGGTHFLRDFGLKRNMAMHKSSSVIVEGDDGEDDEDRG
jgi:hypothetical protein